MPAADWRVCPFWFLTAQLASISLLIDRALAAIIEGTLLNVGKRDAEGRVVPHEQPAWWGLQVFPQLAPGLNASSAAFGADPYRHVSLESFNRHFKAAVHSDEAGIPVHHWPYRGSSVFRKAALQRAKETGLSFAEALAMAGWKTAATMETYYHPHIEDYRPLLTMAGYNPGDGMDPCKRYLPPMDYSLLEECLKEMPESRALIGQHMWPRLEEAREVQQARIDQATAQGEAVHDPHALPFIDLLTEARTIFLVGSCLMISEYPGLACWGLPIFQVGALQPLFSMLGHRVRATCDARAKQRAEMGRSAFEMHEQTMACFQALELKLSKGKSKSAAEQAGIPASPAPEPQEAFPPLPAAIHGSTIVIQWPRGTPLHLAAGQGNLDDLRICGSSPQGLLQSGFRAAHRSPHGAEEDGRLHLRSRYAQGQKPDQGAEGPHVGHGHFCQAARRGPGATGCTGPAGRWGARH